MPWLQLLMDLHGALRAIAILVPTFSLFRRGLSDIAVTWRLWPMWNDLVTAVPHVALVKPRHRIWDVLWPGGPYPGVCPRATHRGGLLIRQQGPRG